MKWTIYSEVHELKADQKDWVQQCSEKIYSLLRETPPDGDNFADIVKKILMREEHWNAWKNGGCPGKVDIIFGVILFYSFPKS